MDDNQNQNTGETSNSGDSKKVKTQVKCPHCGKDYEIEVDVPEVESTPKATWQT